MQKDETDLRKKNKGFRASHCAHVYHSPKTAEAQVLRRQVLRCGTSVGANYREAYRARSKAEFIANECDELTAIFVTILR